MDRISLLSDDLLVKILSFLSTKEAVSTSILSKQWEFLWMWLPRLEFISPWGTKPGHRDFIYKKLPLHRAPFIERLRLVLLSDSLIKPEDIRLWVEIAVSLHVRELIITIYSDDIGNKFPISLFTCKSLVMLKLSGTISVDVPSMVCLPSLKTLKLEFVTFVDGLEQLLSVCPVLEDLSVLYCACGDDMEDYLTITVPSLQSLSLCINDGDNWFLDIGYEIDTPNLKYLKLVDTSQEHEHYDPLIKNMPKLTEAYVDIGYSNLNSIIGSITSVKRLTICSVGVYGDGFVFKNLEKLKLCLCKMTLSKLFVQLLKDSPNLQVLDISGVGDHYIDECSGMVSWNPPSSVPKCLLSSLQIFHWSDYFGRPQDKDIAVYILTNACHLKMVKIESSEESVIPTLDMLKELAFSSRASTTFYNHGDNTLSRIQVSGSNLNQDFSALLQESQLKNQLMKQELSDYDQNICMSDITNNSFQHPCVSKTEHYSGVQESVNNFRMNQLMQKEFYGFDQNMSSMGNINSSSFQHPCVSNTEAVQESMNNYGLDQLMHKQFYGCDQNMCSMGNINNNSFQHPCVSNTEEHYSAVKESVDNSG